VRKLSLLLTFSALVPFPAAHAAAEMDYSQCVAMVDSNPDLAEERSRDWHQQGGGRAAAHCNALALTALKRYAEAAREFEGLSKDRSISFSEHAALLDQAGNAWLLARQGTNALQDFSDALVMTPNDAGLLVDRARARAMMKDWKGAETDLSAVLMRDQNRADVLVLRASARWAMGRKEEAATDIVRSLDLYPDYPPALVERGIMKFSVGDKAGARTDWKKAAASGQGDTAQEARDNLAALDAEGRKGH
jgi:tetratricopeptide (TPR) repeat protein